MDYDIKQLADAIDRDRIERARRVPPSDKLVAGLRLFNRVQKVMADGVRHQFPHATEPEVKAIVSQRLAISRKLENLRDD